MKPPCTQIFYDLGIPVHRELVRHMTFRPLDLVLIAVAVLVLLGQGLLEARAQEPPTGDIGVYTAVEGQVSVKRSGTADALPAKLHDDVRFLDIIETERESRSKALLNDDSILTVGEHSRVEITEHIYDPNRGLRTVVVNLVRGKVRALVGKMFTGTGSKFEIHTPTSVAAARGTYFVVWHVDGVSGIANVGTHGAVDFQSGGSTVRVDPGNFSITPPGGTPSLPAVLSGSSVPAQVAAAVQETTVQDTPKPESPKQAVLSLSGESAMPPAGPLLPDSPTSGNGQPSGSTVPSVTTGKITVPSTVAVTVPAVISGAAGGESSSASSPVPPSPPALPPSPAPVPPAPPASPPPPPPVVVPPPPILPPAIHTDNGLHLGQRGLQPGHGGPIPGHDSGHHGNGHKK